jgi:glycosyltransferase involved in cell wall biosynthesis
MSVDIVVYDTNTENPTGAELSAALAELGLRVRWLLPEGVSKAQLVAPGVEQRQVLAGPRPWTVRRVFRRFVGPFAVVWEVLRRRPVILIWVQDVWDGLIVSILSVVAPDYVYFIHNNPRSVRPRSGIGAQLERWIVRRSHVIVHTDWLKTQALLEHPRTIHVVAHPNYTLTAKSAPPRGPQAGAVAYVGGLRKDKGAESLVDTLLESSGGFEFRTIGQGELSPGDVDRLRERGIGYSGTGHLDQAEFLEELSRVQAVIAPYTQPTESGSVLLCMALGVPVLALDSVTMRRILNDASLFATTADLARGLSRFLQDPWPTFKLSPAEQRQLCRRDLEAALAGGWSRSRRGWGSSRPA